MSPSAATNGAGAKDSRIRFLPLTYDSRDSKASATNLILALRPEWAPTKSPQSSPDSQEDNYVDFVRFTDGITNTLLKAVYRAPSLPKSTVDREAILLRAYGNGTEMLIDREREAANHELLMKHDLAPELLARFENGMLYRYVPGTVSQPQELSQPGVYMAVARRLAEWHARLPCIHDAASPAEAEAAEALRGKQNGHKRTGSIGNAAPRKPVPNLWTTMQKWIIALPTETETQRERQELLQRELEEMVLRLGERPGLGANGLVFAHCDLLSGNIIIHRDGDSKDVSSVSFIDYEYATPSPAAFDLSNHFAEWGGFDCDYNMVPTRGQRQAFISEYIKSYYKFSGPSNADIEEETKKLMQEVDIFRGVPGFYWGIWALIQTMISEIDFDYASYAEQRLGEYWAVKAEEDGSRSASGKEMPLREKTWSRSD